MSAGRGKVIVLMGVCGCGKTTVGERLAALTEGVFVEGDAYHSEANVEKMRSGTPLTDADRQGWLETLAEVIHEHAEGDRHCFVGCSALKEAYREVLRTGDPDLQVVYLHGSRALLQARMEARQGHYMPPGLLDSQLEILEEPREALRVSIDQDPDAIVREIALALSLEGVA